ncbi:MAG TPA: LppX_LprAFG lipoprotein [Acidimicrobiia bacterium]|nr:LppX_LprAFG lipoprotein [Acidimicrobiia bacterium]
MKRQGLLVCVVATFAIAVAACGGGGTGDAAVSIETLQAAASNSQAAESSRYTMDMTVDVAGEPVTITVDGVMAGDGKTGELKVSMPIVGELEERIVDGVIYMNLGSFPGAPAELDGKEWVKLDLEQLKQQDGVFGDLANQAESNSPKQGLEYLQGLSGDVQDLGQEDVGGRPATHYRATIDYAKVLDELPDASAQTRDALGKLGTVPADVWIDDRDRVVKMHLTIDGGALGLGAGTAELAMELSDFGVPVDVQAPPEDQTVDFSSLGSLDV